MKKLFAFTISLFLSIMTISSTFALDSSTVNLLNQYNIVLNELNSQYNTDFHIYTEDEFQSNSLEKIFGFTYSEYTNKILEISPSDLYNQCLEILNDSTEINVEINDIKSRSTQATKTIYFNNNKNKMSLTYKYTISGSIKYFDTSYKPTATVSKVATMDYFQMSSYTGSFKDSNKTYAVVASGKIITIAGTVPKTFTVNFNLN